MEEGKMPENHLSSAVAFVEGGIQEVCDDACSICLEAFTNSDPSTLTSCKHEFHLQCILEWCQRSSQCPMCWQPISLKDHSSQELLDAVEQERNARMNPPRNTTIFRHPTLGDFELQHLPVSTTESELEERIIQHLAAAAAMGRARHFARGEGHQNRSPAHRRPHFLVFSTNPTGTSIDGGGPHPAGEDSVDQPPSAQPNQSMTTAPGSSAGAFQHGTTSFNRTPPSGQNRADRASPSDFQSFSESLKSRLSALSTRYKESITKSTRCWKDRLFTRNSSPLVHREPVPTPPGIVSMSRTLDHLEISSDGQTAPDEMATPNPPGRPAGVEPTSPFPNEDPLRALPAAS